MLIFLIFIGLFLLISVCYARIEEQDKITNQYLEEIQTSIHEIMEILKG